MSYRAAFVFMVLPLPAFSLWQSLLLLSPTSPPYHFILLQYLLLIPIAFIPLSLLRLHCRIRPRSFCFCRAFLSCSCLHRCIISLPCYSVYLSQWVAGLFRLHAGVSVLTGFLTLLGQLTAVGDIPRETFLSE